MNSAWVGSAILIVYFLFVAYYSLYFSLAMAGDDGANQSRAVTLMPTLVGVVTLFDLVLVGLM